MLGYFEESTVLDRYKTREGVLSDHELFLNSDWSRPLDAKSGTQLTTCGHVLHYSCFEKSLEMAKTNENRYAQLRTMREGNWKLTKEFTCMLCSRVCNTVLPLIDRETHKKLRFEPKRNTIEENKQPEPMKKDIKLFEWLSELQEEFGFAKKHKPQNYVINLGEIDMGQVDEAAETDGISAQDQNDNSEAGTRMLTRQAKKQRDSLIQTGNMEEDLNARINNSFDSDGGDLKLDEESIGSSDSEDREFRLSKLKQVLYRHRDIHNKFEKNGKGHYVTSSYSISTSEVLLRYDRKPLMGSLPVRKDKALEFLVRSSLYLQQPFFGNMSFEEDDGVAATRQDARVLIKNLIADPRMTADVPAILTLDLFHAYFTLLLDLPYLDHLKVSKFNLKDNKNHRFLATSTPKTGGQVIFPPFPRCPNHSNSYLYLRGPGRPQANRGCWRSTALQRAGQPVARLQRPRASQCSACVHLQSFHRVLIALHPQSLIAANVFESSSATTGAF